MEPAFQIKIEEDFDFYPEIAVDLDDCENSFEKRSTGTNQRKKTLEEIVNEKKSLPVLSENHEEPSFLEGGNSSELNTFERQDDDQRGNGLLNSYNGINEMNCKCSLFIPSPETNPEG